MKGKFVKWDTVGFESQATETKTGLMVSYQGTTVIVVEVKSAIKEPFYGGFPVRVEGDALKFFETSEKLASHLGVQLPTTYKQVRMLEMNQPTVLSLTRHGEQLWFGNNHVMEDLEDIFHPTVEQILESELSLFD